MITLLHGDYIEASRSEMLRIKEASKDKDVRVIDGKAVDDTTLVQSIESSSLFGNTTLIIIEQLFGKLGKQRVRSETFASILQKNAKENDIILWEDKEIGAGTIKLLGPLTEVRKFALPVLIFQFLDNFRPGNGKMLLALYEKLLTSEPAELVFAMLTKRIRQLIQLSDGVTPEGLAGWQIQRLTMQSKSFTMEQLINIYKKLHAIEVKARTGASPFTTSQQLELLVGDL
jgi:hypothetical protein